MNILCKILYVLQNEIAIIVPSQRGGRATQRPLQERSGVGDGDIPYWADFPPSKRRLTGRIKSVDVLIRSGGTGSGLLLIIEEALWAIAFLMGRKANRTGHSLIWNSSLILMNYELNPLVGGENCIYITLLTSVSCFMCARFSLHWMLLQK